MPSRTGRKASWLSISFLWDGHCVLGLGRKLDVQTEFYAREGTPSSPHSAKEEQNSEKGGHLITPPTYMDNVVLDATLSPTYTRICKAKWAEPFNPSPPPPPPSLSLSLSLSLHKLEILNRQGLYRSAAERCNVFWKGADLDLHRVVHALYTDTVGLHAMCRCLSRHWSRTFCMHQQWMCMSTSSDTPAFRSFIPSWVCFVVIFVCKTA